MLNEITFSYKVSENQNDLFTPYHCRYEVRLSVNGCDDYVTDYQCNKKETPSLNDVLECIINDSVAYQSTEDVLDFAYQYGYKDEETARAAYRACKDAYMWFETEWTNDQFCEVYDELFE